MAPPRCCWLLAAWWAGQWTNHQAAGPLAAVGATLAGTGALAESVVRRMGQELGRKEDSLLQVISHVTYCED